MRASPTALQWLWLLPVLAVGALAFAPLAASRETPAIDEQAKVRLRSVTVRFEPKKAARPGECNEMTLDDLEVRLRGELLPRDALVDLEHDLRPTIHALLIDASGSMVGKLGFVRDAAADYVSRLESELELSLVATFDESVILVSGATRHHDELADEVSAIRMGMSTSMFDALYYMMRELEGYRERPVVILLTDGVDSGSVYERRDIKLRCSFRDDLTVFSIGYQLPPLDVLGPRGGLSTRRFLQRVAAWSNGKFFDVSTGSRLDDAFAKIREMLDSEAVLTFVDPDPDAEGDRVKVRSKRERCSVETFRAPHEFDDDELDEDVQAPDRKLSAETIVAAGEAAGAGPGAESIVDAPVGRQDGAEPGRTLPDDGELWQEEFPFLPDRRVVKWFKERRDDAFDAACAPEGDEDPWFARTEPERIHTCGLDITMEPGLLYATANVTRWQNNGWLRLRVRPLDIPTPRLGELPTDPVQILDGLANYMLDEAGESPRTDIRKRPADKHARPYYDVPALCHGRTFLDSRPSLARAMYAYPWYREWVHDRLQREVDDEILAVEGKFRLYAPDRPLEEIRQVVRQSPEGRRILERATQPSVGAVQNHLAAWLGDVSAHDLFVRWEAERTSRSLADGEWDSVGFERQWQALRRLFFVPSYARVLTLLTPVYDRATDRIGFWRVVLPRPSWFLPRVRGYKRHPELTNLPLDLVPDLPFAYHVVADELGKRPDLRAAIAAEGLRVVDIRYELLASPHKHDPRRAFMDTRVVVVFGHASERADPAPGRYYLSARVTLDRETHLPTIEDVAIDTVDPAESVGLRAASP